MPAKLLKPSLQKIQEMEALWELDMKPLKLRSSVENLRAQNEEHIMEAKRCWINNIEIVAHDHERGGSQNSWVLCGWKTSKRKRRNQSSRKHGNSSRGDALNIIDEDQPGREYDPSTIEIQVCRVHRLFLLEGSNFQQEDP